MGPRPRLFLLATGSALASEVVVKGLDPEGCQTLGAAVLGFASSTAESMSDSSETSCPSLRAIAAASTKAASSSRGLLRKQRQG